MHWAPRKTIQLSVSMASHVLATSRRALKLATISSKNSIVMSKVHLLRVKRMSVRHRNPFAKLTNSWNKSVGIKDRKR